MGAQYTGRVLKLITDDKLNEVCEAPYFIFRGLQKILERNVIQLQYSFSLNWRERRHSKYHLIHKPLSPTKCNITNGLHDRKEF